MAAKRGGGPGREWTHDEGGRRYREESGTRVYETTDDRDAGSEARYSYDRGDYRSTLGYVSANIDTLVVDFWTWVQAWGRSDGLDAVRDWEIARFGQRLFPAAHGMLMRAVRLSLSPHADAEQRGRRLSPEDQARAESALPRGDRTEE